MSMRKVEVTTAEDLEKILKVIMASKIKDDVLNPTKVELHVHVNATKTWEETE